MSQILILGGTAGMGRELAAHYVKAGNSVVISGRTGERAKKVAAEVEAGHAQMSGTVRGIAVDLAQPTALRNALADVSHVDSLVLAGMLRDMNTVKNYDINSAVELTTVKIVGYTTAVHVLQSRLSPRGSVLLFGGVSKDMPYPGSTTISAVNAAIVGLTATLAEELAPVRVNAIHPGAVVDSPYWAGKEAALEPVRQRTLTGRLPTMAEVIDGCVFLLDNPSANGVNLNINGGLGQGGRAAYPAPAQVD